MTKHGPPVPPHPTRGSATAVAAIGGAIAAVSLPLLPWLGAGALALGSVGAALLFFGIRTRTAGRGVQILNQAANALQIGDLARAEELLSAVDQSRTLGYIRRTADLHRGTIAMRRGDLAASLSALDAAVARRIAWLTREQERWHVMEGRGLRAFVRAAAGDASAAREDAAAIRASEHTSPHALACAELAEAMVLEREGDRPRLATHLARHRTLLFEHTSPRQRAIVRAYHRLVRATSSTVYRTAAPRDPEPRAAAEPTLADWVSMIAPAAAPFVRAPGKSTAPAAAVERAAADPSESVRGAAARRFAKARRGPRPALVLGTWVIVVLLFVGVWQLLEPTTLQELEPLSTAMPSPVSSLAALLVVWALLCFGLIAWKLRRFRRSNRELAAALRQLASGDVEGARTSFEALGKHRLVLVAAQADAALASIAARTALWSDALALADRGIHRLRKNEQTRVTAADILLPSLHAERARALAALDRTPEASAEITLLAETFPAYPFLSLARHRVALMELARGGDVAAAARMTEAACDDLPLDIRDDLLGETARLAASRDAPEGDKQRLRDELRADPATRRWLEQVAPAFVAAFEHPNDPDSSTASDDQAEVEREAQAEAEAAQVHLVVQSAYSDTIKV